MGKILLLVNKVTWLINVMDGRAGPRDLVVSPLQAS